MKSSRGKQPCQDVKGIFFFEVSGTVPIFRVLLVVWQFLVPSSHQQHAEDGHGVSARNVGKPSHLYAAVCREN